MSMSKHVDDTFDEEEQMLLTAAYLQLQDYEETEALKEKKVSLDEKLVTTLSATRTV